ncbi:DUF1543 domain-containing protein [Paraburkholderia bryophila]|uniref:Uncharacterized protein DUF1543 n=1 Tax=Paraburkholderia bryophila TaxID=420952 RepID=A0A329CJS6_9BURK|nr:DUF1543 domain-containing protein [Paraburkholderia bryophila]RAS34327.1 uncharacterized protein DUF1543 [Paraburkholderia bryophila]
MDLFIFYVGGNAGKSNIEVHDIQFVVAEHPEQAWPTLREAWFGDKGKLHIDGYARIKWADGYRVTLSCERPVAGPKLFFVNVGAYTPDSLAELHEFGLFVADSPANAKENAMKRLLSGRRHRHKDNLRSVDDCIALEQVGEMFVHLTPHSDEQSFGPEWQGYQPIGI